jgi:thymidylate synthase (FAD)
VYARLVSYTQWSPEYLAASGIPDGLVSPEGPVAYTARVSSPNPLNESYERLLTYCIRKGHWSVFEMADATVELETSRAIAAQILRHRSFTFQEFSQRYSAVEPSYEASTCRMQDNKNRQSSLECSDPNVLAWWEYTQRTQAERAFANYQEALSLGIAKEVARMLLPLSVTTKLYMKGSLRSWLHYLNTRLDPSTQLEHRELAQAILTQLAPVYPVIFQAAQEVYPNLVTI